MQKTSATLWPEEVERLRGIGADSVSEGIRRVLEHYEQSAPGRESQAVP